MCLGIPGRVVAMVEGYGDQLALVDVEGASRRVNIGLLDPGAVGPGDWVLIHMGLAVERVDEQQAAETRVGLELMGRGVDEL
jgi:hydrogenase expression/formation protein HypC